MILRGAKNTLKWDTHLNRTAAEGGIRGTAAEGGWFFTHLHRTAAEGGWFLTHLHAAEGGW